MSVLGNAKSNSHRIKTHQVELDGASRKSMFLPGETSTMRAVEESAEAVVVMKPIERSEERRAEESRKNRNPDLSRLDDKREKKKPGDELLNLRCWCREEKKSLNGTDR